MERIHLEAPLGSTVLEFHCERIKRIENLEELTELKKLGIVSNLVEKIENLEANTQLETLDLYQNCIKVIENIGHLRDLRILDVSFNQIERIENIDKLVNLRELYLTSNKIAKVENVATLANLELLELGSNRIRDYGEIKLLTGLTSLWLGRNKITHMQLPLLPNLTKLSLQNNRIREWDASIVESCPRICELYLSFNRLDEIPSWINGMVSKCCNHITNAYQKCLNILDLGSNRISRINLTEPNDCIEELWLNDNALEGESDIETLRLFKKLKVLYLEHNPIQAKLGPGYRNRILDILPTHSIVQRVIDNIKKKAAEHAGRHARAKLRDGRLPLARRPPAQATTSSPRQTAFHIANQAIVRRNSGTIGDYFTRLVNSSPKPRVLKSIHHPVAIHLYKLAHSASYRKYRRLILLTSPKLIREHCERHGSCSRIYTTSHENPLLMEPRIRADRVLVCSEKLLQKIADLHSYKNGIIAEVPYPQPSQHLGNAALVLCVAPGSSASSDNVPAATLVRTAHALQWQAVWLLRHGEHDLLDPRAIRASQNCLDTIPYITGDARAALVFANEKGLLVCICSDGGYALESDYAQQAIQRHRGMMLLVGKQPKVLPFAPAHITAGTCRSGDET
ncbi:Protein phosphatase 1 regulatory subunit 7 [Babesia sp. Xinjiang]|uniref:Protein phosphatase 1 regulatory subunit 7 n=1 Tax=Babesia sp. Xinjiang TaxID=462227 RepID=UPI000A22FC8F|nr:Protein phosphatase 1 regulatory subunit 7 [Babesia sp. Xinjiang]ORM40715.1 Protein phosphatase 1 regulatory subunit 7 [Babesia sp. Xinjiang]